MNGLTITMNSRSPQLDIAAIRQHLADIDPTGQHLLRWATKDENTGAFREKSLANAEDIVKAIRDEVADPLHTSLYICNATFRVDASGRGEDQIEGVHLVWADYDDDKADKPFPHHLFTADDAPLKQYTTIRHSGRSKNRHLYPHLSRRAGWKLSRILNFALAQTMAADDKWPANALLRLDGSFNYRVSKGLTTPQPVTTLQRATAAIDPKELLRILLPHTGMTLEQIKHHARPALREAIDVIPCDQQELLRRIAPRLRSTIRSNDLMGLPGNDESQQLYNLYRDILQQSDFAKADLYTLMMSFEPFVDRMGHRSEAEINKVYDEFENDERRQAKREEYLMGSKKAATPDPQDEPETRSEVDGLDHVEDLGYITWNDETNAQYLIKYHHKDFFALIDVLGDPLYWWNGSIWVTGPEANKAIDEICAAFQRNLDCHDENGQLSPKVYRQANSLGTRNNMIKLFKRRIGKTLPELDPDPTLLHMGTAVYESETGTIRKPRREDMMTKRTRVDYDPEATCPNFELHLKGCLPDDDVRDYTAWLLSRVLEGSAQKDIGVFVGEGNTGKSQVILGVAYPLGQYAKRVADEVALLKPGTHHASKLHMLRDARLGMIHEPSKGQRFNIEQLKSLSGGDQQTSNPMRGNPEEWDPRLLLLITCNTVPSMGGDLQLADRLKFIRFDNVIEPGRRNPKFAREVLFPEAAGILNWLIRTHQHWVNEQKAGNYKPAVPAAVRAANDSVALEQNPIARFLDEMVETGQLERSTSTVRIRTGQVYEMYVKWAQASRQEKVTPNKFSRDIQALGITKRKVGGTPYFIGLVKGTRPNVVEIEL